MKMLSISKKWEMTASRFVLLFSLLNTILFNGALFSFLAANLDLYTISGLLIAFSATILTFLINILLISLLVIIIPFFARSFLAITFLINSIAFYYMVTYQVILDRTMMGNIFNTRGSEASELITPTLLMYFLILGVIPTFLVLKTKIKTVNRMRILAHLVIAFIFSLVFLYANSASWLWLDKYAKLLGGKVLPWSYIINTVRHYSHASKSSINQILLPEAAFANDKKIVVVLVIGESARSSNFSLYGYPRETNPLLSQQELLVFDRSSSCNTYTTASVACMLSYKMKSTKYEPLPSYLYRSGADVVWRANNWGEPTVHVTDYQKMSELKKLGDVKKGDGVLLNGLKERIQSSDKQKIFVVLHTKGSHGASYYKRYPSEFEQFTPVCRHEEISKCTDQELINAYDNTILYTDYLLDKMIKELKSLTDTPSMLVYMSDHGESLGEEGLYLHGTPYMFAPKYQKEVPFLIWRSEGLIKRQGITNKQVNQLGEFTQGNIYHTIVGAFDLETTTYDSNLDVLH